MLRWAEARLRQVAAGHPGDAPKVYESGAEQQAAGLVALLESEGYRPARYFNKMVRSLAEPIPDLPLPPGLELRPVRPEQYRPIWDASHEAFRDHWGYSPWPEEEYERWLNNPVEFRPELWQVAWDVETDEIAGQIQTFIDARENEKFGRRRGYTEGISVRRPYRRRGLARAMIMASLRALQAHGMTESALNVDAESLTGATRLYEACGFVTDSAHVAYRKPLDAPDA
jgi:ribosomal protein S18 acetylase RimI-like enzyme